MTIRFLCPNCAGRIGADDHLNSERITCPRCQSSLYVPDPTESGMPTGGMLTAAEAPIDFASGSQRAEVEMDMTPMVDVTFLLLIFFMVTAAFSLQKSFEIPTPKEDRPSSKVVTLDDFEDDPEYVVVRIDENSTFYISASHWDEEREAPSMQDLRVGLADARNADGPVPTRLLLVVHGNAWHEKVIMAMDAGTDAGISDIKLVTIEDDT